MDRIMTAAVPVGKVEITLMSSGQIGVNWTIPDKLQVLGLMAIAQATVIAWDPQKQPRIQLPEPHENGLS